MNRYIDADKLIAEIERRKALLDKYTGTFETAGACKQELLWMKDFISARCQVQPDMIQWTGNNLKEVIDFTGKSPRFEEWFKSWEDFENYVHSHGDIFKLFCEDGSHYEVPVGAWIIKTPDGYNVPSVAKYINKEQPSLPANLSEAAIQAAQIDMCDRQIMEDSNEHKMLYSRIFRRGFKAGAEWGAELEKSVEFECIGRKEDSHE